MEIEKSLHRVRFLHFLFISFRYISKNFLQFRRQNLSQSLNQCEEEKKKLCSEISSKSDTISNLKTEMNNTNKILKDQQEQITQL